MAQASYQVDQVVGNEAAAKKLQNEGMTLAEVKWVNVNQSTGVVVVTHNDGFDEHAFQALIDAL